MGKLIMIQGTASGVGKTTLALALCRIFRQDGYKVAPFKAQNMTQKTMRTECGGEIAISQLMQAYAAQAEAVTEMNPVILKPAPCGQGIQVILNGRQFDTLDASGLKEIKTKTLLPEIMRAFDSLSKRYDIVVIEGAGSPVELNLNKDDIVNMGIAKRLDAPVLLVADIDRGGVFASLYGTIRLLDEDERKYVKATVVNRFRGELASFEDGVSVIEKITGLPVAGVVPYISFDLPEEDEAFDGGRREEIGELAVHSLISNGGFEREFDAIADHVRGALDMELIYRMVERQ